MKLQHPYSFYIKTALFWLLMLTWGLPQTISGLIIMFTRFRKCPRSTYHGAIVVRHNGDFGGMSLGGVIFVSEKFKPDHFDAIRAHEFGHCIQSLFLGPLYLPIICLPSSLWCNLPVCTRHRNAKNISYYSFFTESWANRLAMAFTKDIPPER